MVDLILGMLVFFLSVIVFPKIAYFVRPYWNPGANKGKGAWLPMGAEMKTWSGIFHFGVWIAWIFVKIIALIAGLFGTLLFLSFSVGWVNPLSWNGFVYDLIYARANGAPNGAHILSYLGLPIFGLVVCYKFQWRPWKKSEDVLGDPFQGMAAAAFLGGVHEAIWITLYYLAYADDLSWSILPEVLRDVAFVAMILLFIGAFWKIPNRKFPMSIFAKPILLYTGFCLAWFFLPYLFGFPFFPITTINNPRFGSGLYQETPWYSLWWVNSIEVISWVMLYVSFVWVVVKYKNELKT